MRHSRMNLEKKHKQTSFTHARMHIHPNLHTRPSTFHVHARLYHPVSMIAASTLRVLAIIGCFESGSLESSHGPSIQLQHIRQHYADIYSDAHSTMRLFM